MKYLYEKKYTSGTKRLIFNSSKELFEYLQEQGERIFNDGFSDASIGLYRVKEYKKIE